MQLEWQVCIMLYPRMHLLPGILVYLAGVPEVCNLKFS